MQKISLLLLALLVFFCWTCGEDDEPMMATPPAISITSTVDDGATVCVGQSVDLVFSVTSPSELVSSFVITKNGSQEITNVTNIFVNNYTFNLTYAFSQDDLTNGSVDLQVIVTDEMGTKVEKSIAYTVIAEYTFLQEAILPNPGLDLVANTTFDSDVGDNLDIVIISESQSCGSFCTENRYTFTSNNDTRFYSIPTSTGITYFSNNYKTADIETAIAGMTGEQSLVVYSNFSQDITGTGAINRYPVIADIRGKGEYAIIGTDGGNDRRVLLYRKRSESAGE